MKLLAMLLFWATLGWLFSLVLTDYRNGSDVTFSCVCCFAYAFCVLSDTIKYFKGKEL